MQLDEDYLEKLLKSVDKLVNPNGEIPEDRTDDIPDMPEEELDEVIAEPQEMELEEETVPMESSSDVIEEDVEAPAPVVEEVPAEEPVVEEPVAEETATPDLMDILDVDPDDGNKILSPDEISAMFAAAEAVNGGDSDPEPAAEEAPAEGETAPIDEEAVLSADDIDALLNAAKESAAEPEELAGGDDDLMALLASAGDEDLGDIQSLLQSDENGEAVDADALIAATTVEDVAADILDEDGGKKKKKKKEKKKKEKKAKDENVAEDGEKKPGFFARLLNSLTESDDDDEDGSGKEAIPDDLSELDISDENREILAALEGEDDKKKSKKEKKKKDKKAKKGKKGKGADGEDSLDDIREKGDDEEDGGKKKKKKEKKPKKVKEVKEKEPEKPLKKLPKKKVRATFLLCLSLLAAMLVGIFGFTSLNNMREARWAFDNQDYETTYENLYGMKLGEKDEVIFNKSQTILQMDRKYTSYQNFARLGMQEEALNALIEAVGMYPDLRNKAAKYGVEAQVDYTYSQIIAALGTYGIDEAQADEIARYDSKVKYNLKIKSIVYGTEFTYGEEAAPSEEPVEEMSDVQTVDDILPEEVDFLPEDPNAIFE